MSRIRFERPDHLAPHPMLARVGTMLSLANHYQIRAKKAGKNRDDHKAAAEELEGDFQALVQSIAANGILEPIKICRIPADDASPRMLGTEWWIVDGRNRWQAAQMAKLKRVPVIRVSPSEAPEIIAATVAGRRHYSKGATAYLACLLHPEVAAASQGKRNDLSTYALSAEVLAQKFAVSHRLLVQAIELFRLLDGEGKPFREDAEASIWAGAGLGGVKAGVDFLIANGKAETPRADPGVIAAANAWQSFRRAGKAVTELWTSWEKLDAERRETALAGMADWLAGAPNEARSALLDAIAAQPTH